MKVYNFTLVALLASLAIGFYGCEGRPERKKLPDFFSLEGWEDTPLPKADKVPFYLSDTTITEGGKFASFLSITMADPMYDSVAVHMAESYQPFASILIEKWAKEKKKGILIDLRTTTGSNIQRADFLLKKSLPDNPNFKIPIIFIWDPSSSYRYDYFVNALASMPDIKCSLVSESRQVEGVGRNDCFSPVQPDFDQE
ncbi:MAG: hypothetical protein C5B59_09330 [Bacteroidetes bacterium]|nr:MAG: hypothetical protein C5B59_09330 [Bacteroidota bacterium]